MAERQVFIDRVKGAERECYVVAAAVNHYEKAVQASNAKLPSICPRPRRGEPIRDLLTELVPNADQARPDFKALLG